MEYIGVPLVSLVRSLGPPVVLLVVGAVLIVRQRPVGARLLWAALAVNLVAAALPFVWRFVQVGTGFATESVAGLVMMLLQPLVEFCAWLLVLGVVVSRGPAGQAMLPEPARSRSRDPA
ncbi:hypothetical protein CLV63_11037 [Murinocardiopsis flavida]|uniref:Uncharacterized protein n=1 Tax=Murinocardiopsis flavida TaxID=645275 RepID=A0A2P8DHP4_9ACTN|nr:hypothetical protein [Murinocardiopsis flavida]PSK96740.1 hypothetical protein CLV63_11037 [Murinocardiopsis flavida]